VGARRARDTGVFELVREVDAAVEDMIASRKGCIAKRLGDGPMATFLSAKRAR
jgi:class 3 adenylate cyclase